MALYGAPSRHHLRREEKLDGDYRFTRAMTVDAGASLDIEAGATLTGFPNGLDATVLQPPTYTVAEAPDATEHTGALIYVTDGDAGDPCLALSDGTNWLVGIATDAGTPISDGA